MYAHLWFKRLLYIGYIAYIALYKSTFCPFWGRPAQNPFNKSDIRDNGRPKHFHSAEEKTSLPIFKRDSRIKDDATMEKVYYAGIVTSMGTVWAAATDKGLVQVHASGREESFLSRLKRRVRGEYICDPSKFEGLKEQLDSWNEGKPTGFDLPFDLRGTEFQKKVWKAIHDIPYGRLSSYGRLAEAIGKPRAARAVGNAVGSNPCGIVIPCHRVIWSNGGLGGFRGGYDDESLNEKRMLLAKEGVLPRVEDYPEKEVDLTGFFV